MNEYLNPVKAAAGIFLAAHFWPALNRYVNHGPVLIVGGFWFMDWLLGSFLAWRSRTWSPSICAKSVRKMLTWAAALWVTNGLRDSGQYGLGVLASMIELVILTSESTSIFRNLSKLSPGESSSVLLGRFADSVERVNPLAGAIISARRMPDRKEAQQIQVEAQAKKEESHENSTPRPL